MLAKIILVFSAAVLFLNTSAAVPGIWFYNKAPSSASTFSFHSSTDRPDLTPIFPYFTESSISVCALGIWLIHWHAANYTSSPYLFYNDDGCQTFTNGFYQIGSVRVVKDVENGVANSGFNVYSDLSWTGNATTFEINQPRVSVNFSSLILTGTRAVQLYLVENYIGFSYCFEPELGRVYRALGNSADVGLKPGDVRSFRFGCNFANKLI